MSRVLLLVFFYTCNPVLYQMIEIVAKALIVLHPKERRWLLGKRLRSDVSEDLLSK